MHCELTVQCPVGETEHDAITAHARETATYLFIGSAS
jgi:hypothetical protein